MRHITNAVKDKIEGASMSGIEVADYLDWREQFVEGKPQKTAGHSVAELEQFGMVGLYLEDADA